MEELKNVLATHLERYPMMEPCDLVKLLYQGEFGPAHLVADPERAIFFLEQEYAAAAKEEIPLWEDIGGGMGRIYLAALPEGKFPALCRAFLASAAATEACSGDIARFKEKLAVLEELTLPFPRENLDAYLKEYAAAGYPRVSHSETYRACYRPAYRVILKRFAEEEGLL